MKPTRIIVIGGVASGPAAAAEARRTDPDANITLIERGQDISYSACEMPLVLAGGLDDAERLVRYTPEAFASRFRVDVKILHEVESIDSEKRKLIVRNQRSNASIQVNYDRLILATGARAILPKALSLVSKDVYTLRTLQDTRLIQSAVQDRSYLHAVVVGAGYVGLDAAWALRSSGVRVTLLAPSGILASGLDPEISQIVASHLRHENIQIRPERASGIEKAGDGRVIAVLTDKGEKIGCDLVLAATGTTPVAELAVQIGLKIGRSGGVLVDDQMRTSQAGIWACGDCTERNELVFSETIRAPLSLNAFRSGRVAGRNAARGGHGRPAKLAPLVHAAALSLGALEVGHTGWTQRQAEGLGKKVQSCTIHHRSATSLYPNSPVHITLIAESDSGRVVGAQIAGDKGSAQRVNVITTLIRGRGTVDDLYNVDYVYAPPLAPAHDPLLVAARTLQKLMSP